VTAPPTAEPRSSQAIGAASVPGSERFSARLRRRADGIWQAQHAHPFVRGIGDGTLDVARFRHWVRQDYRFLIEYCRLFGLAAARAPDLDTLARFADLLQATARTEMDLHRAYAAELGIAPAELEEEPMAPTTRAYTDFLVRVAATGDFAELAAALLPCMWGFSEIGQALAARGVPADPRYAKWVRMYADLEFAALAGWCRELVDRLAAGTDDATRGRMEDAFLTSSRYEYLFWEMAWRLEAWPV
jgi:thiaminase/transcriptional activator TenA